MKCPWQTQLWKTLFVLILWDVGVTLLFMVFNYQIHIPDLPLPMIGSAFVLFVSLLNTHSYARWWEGRTLWGNIINLSRSFAREILSILPPSLSELRRQFIYQHLAYTHALASSIQRRNVLTRIEPFLPTKDVILLQEVSNIPHALLFKSTQQLGDLMRQGQLNEIQFTALLATLKDLTNAQGGIERINNTRLPWPYVFLPLFFIQIFSIVLPISLVAHFQWYTPVLSTLISFMFFALNFAGQGLQNPFDNSAFSIPVDDIVQTIETNLMQMLPHQPRDQ